MKQVSQEVIARRWREAGFSCELWVDPPGQTWENFVHEADERVCVLEGAVEFKVDGKKTRLTSGEEICIPAHTRHSARNAGRKTARWLYGYKNA